jgi:hypothetical protein
MIATFVLIICALLLVLPLGNNTGSGNPHGLRVRVPPGTGTGCLFGTRAKPVPAVQVAGYPRIFVWVLSTQAHKVFLCSLFCCIFCTNLWLLYVVYFPREHLFRRVR